MQVNHMAARREPPRRSGKLGGVRKPAREPSPMDAHIAVGKAWMPVLGTEASLALQRTSRGERDVGRQYGHALAEA
jgi:hypothetical protein